MYWWRLKSNATIRATGSNIVIVIVITVGIVIACVNFHINNQHHAIQHQHHQHPPHPPSPPMHRAERRMDVVSPPPPMEVQAGMCEKSRVGTVLPGNFRKTPQKPMRNAPIPPVPTNAQNTKQQEKHNTEAAFAWTSSPPHPASPPHQCTAPEHTRTRSRSKTQDTIALAWTSSDPPSPPPHPCTELKYKWKLKLACAKGRESAKTQKKNRCEMRNT